MILATPPRERIAGAVAATAMTGLFGWALITGLGFDPVQRVVDTLQTFTVAPEPPPPPPDPVIPPPKRDPRPEGEAAPPNLRSKATEATAPKPIVVVPVPPPIVVAEKPGPGAQSTSGAADVPGPGTGAGGVGNGFGSGGSGDGDGGGWEDETPPRRIRGDIGDADYPAALADAGIGGTVGVTYTVEVNGRATHCEVTRSSGNARLDALTCSYIERRFRYRPSLDARGRPVPSTIVENHSWIPERASGAD